MLLPHDESGTGPTVVLLHARPTDRRMWREHLPLLAAAGYRAIALDLPGYGEAVLPERHETTPADDVLETLDALDVDRFTLVGNSLGALVGLQTAVAAPARVDGLLSIGYRRHDQPPSVELNRAWQRERDALDAVPRRCRASRGRRVALIAGSAGNARARRRNVAWEPAVAEDTRRAAAGVGPDAGRAGAPHRTRDGRGR